MLRIGIDVDGTLNTLPLRNPDLILPQILFVFLFPLTFFAKAKKEAVVKVRRMKNRGNSIIVISARPYWAINLTKKWLKRNRIPFDKVLCVGFGKGTRERKLKAIKKERIRIFFDDDKRILKLLNCNSVKASNL